MNRVERAANEYWNASRAMHGFESAPKIRNMGELIHELTYLCHSTIYRIARQSGELLEQVIEDSLPNNIGQAEIHQLRRL